MIRKDLAVGVVLVLLGATCYGVLSTFVKLAYEQGYTPAEVLTSQFITGFGALGIVQIITMKRQRAARTPASQGDKIRLVIGGSTIGFTGTFYYLSVSYTSVSAAIVLLMQSVWMGVLLDAVLTRQIPSWLKIVSSALVVVGTVLATNIVSPDTILSPIGIGYGLLAAFSYTGVIWCSKNIGALVHPISRSFLMITGGMIAVIAIAMPHLLIRFDLSVFWKWGWVVAILGTILPPFLFNRGVPATSVGLATILSSIELPVAVIMARFILGESFSASQWVGVATIILAIFVSNADLGRTRHSSKEDAQIEATANQRI